MTILYPLPIGVYTILALVLLVGARRGRALKCVLVTTYCGVMITTFTGGPTGGLWLAQLFLLVTAPVIFWGGAVPGFGSTSVARLTYAVLLVYLAGIVVGLVRFDPMLETIKAGRYTSLAGIPVSILMAGYRVLTVCTVALAFTLPLRTRIDKSLLVGCLKLSWLFSVALAVLSVLSYTGIAELGFDPDREAVQIGVILMGFHRASWGLMLVAGVFLSFALTQLSRNFLLNSFVYASAPLLLLGLLFSWSRAGTLALAVGAISLVFTLGASRAFKGVVLSVVGVLTILVIFTQFPELRDRFSLPAADQLEEVSAGRLESWPVLIAWLIHRPDVLMFGVGFQDFPYYAHLISGAVDLGAGHNNFLHILTESGILGLTLFVMWFLSIFLWLASWRRAATTRNARAIPGILISFMLAVAVSCLTQESVAPFGAMTPFTLHFYLILGIWIGYYRTTMMEQAVQE